MSDKKGHSKRRRRALLVGRYPVLPEGHVYFEVWVELGYKNLEEEDAIDADLELEALFQKLPERPFQLGLFR